MRPLPGKYQFDVKQDQIDWDLELADPGLAEASDRLTDPEAWHVANLLLMEKSPMLWFYLQRRDGPRRRKSRRELSTEFLGRRFVRARTERVLFLRQSDDTIRPKSKSMFPGLPADPVLRRIVEQLDPDAPIRETLAKTGVETSDTRQVERLRRRLTTTAFPFVRAARSNTSR